MCLVRWDCVLDSSRAPPPQAANPGCVLEDFVRWYSPRDYVEEEEQTDGGETVVKGSLSARMKIPGNMWVEAWETARVTPARRQKRLFDDTKEAEKVMKTMMMMQSLSLARVHSSLLRGERLPSCSGRQWEATLQHTGSSFSFCPSRLSVAEHKLS